MRSNRANLDHHDPTNFEHLDLFSLLAKAWSLQPLGHDHDVVAKNDHELEVANNATKRSGWFERLSQWLSRVR